MSAAKQFTAAVPECNDPEGLAAADLSGAAQRAGRERAGGWW